MGTRWLESCVVWNVFVGCEYSRHRGSRQSYTRPPFSIEAHLSICGFPVSTQALTRNQGLKQDKMDQPENFHARNPGRRSRRLCPVRGLLPPPDNEKSGMKKGFSSSAEMRNRAHLYLFPGALQNREHGAPPSRGGHP